MRPCCLHVTLLCLALLLGVVTAHSAPQRPLSADEQRYLARTLKQAGCPPDGLDQLLARGNLQYLPGMVSMNVIQKDYSHNYRRFLEPAALERAWRFARHWRTRLAVTEQQFGVERYVIVAILLVETRLGAYTGNVHILSTYASILLDNRPAQRSARANSLTDPASRERYLRRLERKARWATNELTALIALHRRDALDATQLRGSFAGAFGLCQFLPSSYQQWAHNGTGSGRVDLFWPPHAFCSIANYLRSHGWNDSLSRSEKKKIIWHYNHLNIYASTVLEISEALRKRAAKIP